MQSEYMNNYKLVITMHFFLNSKNKFEDAYEMHFFNCLNFVRIKCKIR